LLGDEALLEGAHTPVAYRGKGIMAEAMALIAERARDFGARYVLTFVEHDNVASLKGCKKAGFAPHLIRHDQVFLFHLLRRLRFEPFPTGSPLPYETAVIPKQVQPNLSAKIAV
jgi:GNAT superfamily N-acetyltransferase